MKGKIYKLLSTALCITTLLGAPAFAPALQAQAESREFYLYPSASGKTIEGDVHFIQVNATSDGAISATLDGSAITEGNAQNKRGKVEVNASGGNDATLTVNGSIFRAGIFTGSDTPSTTATATLHVKGDINYDPDLDRDHESGNNAAICIQRASESSDASSIASAESYSIYVEVDGTIHCGNWRLVAGQGTYSNRSRGYIAHPEKIQIVAWGVDAGTLPEGTTYSAAEQVVMDNLRYKIRFNAAPGVTYVPAGSTDSTENLTAKEGDTIQFKVNLQNGYTLERVRLGSDELTADSDGIYSIRVPKGGGVSISTDVIAPTPSEHHDEPEEETPTPAQLEVDKVTEYDGHAASIPSNIPQATVVVGGNKIDIDTSGVQTQTPATSFVSAPPKTDVVGQTLNAYANLLNAGSCLSMTKYQLFTSGKPVIGNYGTIQVNMHITSAWEGKEVLLMIWGPDGGVRVEKVRVTNGAIPVLLAEHSYVAVYSLN